MLKQKFSDWTKYILQNHVRSLFFKWYFPWKYSGFIIYFVMNTAIANCLLIWVCTMYIVQYSTVHIITLCTLTSNTNKHCYHRETPHNWINNTRSLSYHGVGGWVWVWGSPLYPPTPPHPTTSPPPYPHPPPTHPHGRSKQIQSHRYSSCTVKNTVTQV